MIEIVMEIERERRWGEREREKGKGRKTATPGPASGQTVSPFGWLLSISQEQYVNQDLKNFYIIIPFFHTP